MTSYDKPAPELAKTHTPDVSADGYDEWRKKNYDSTFYLLIMTRAICSVLDERSTDRWKVFTINDFSWIDVVIDVVVHRFSLQDKQKQVFTYKRKNARARQIEERKGEFETILVFLLRWI